MALTYIRRTVAESFVKKCLWRTGGSGWKASQLWFTLRNLWEMCVFPWNMGCDYGVEVGSNGCLLGRRIAYWQPRIRSREEKNYIHVIKWLAANVNHISVCCYCTISFHSFMLTRLFCFAKRVKNALWVCLHNISFSIQSWNYTTNLIKYWKFQSVRLFFPLKFFQMLETCMRKHVYRLFINKSLHVLRLHIFRGEGVRLVRSSVYIVWPYTIFISASFIYTPNHSHL